jgi:hypothetical protein
MLYKYLVMEGRYNIDEEAADLMFVTYDKEEAIEAAKDFGQGIVVVSIDDNGSKQRVFTAPYKSDLGLEN